MVSKFIQKEDWEKWSSFFDGNGDATFLPTFDQTEPDEIAKKWVDRQLKRYAERNFGMQWLIEKKTGKQLGQCGLLYQDINGTMELEVGYSFFKSAWGKGYATEAAIMFRDYGFREFDVDSIISLIDPKNKPSQKVAERNGMTQGAIVEWKGLTLHVWRITRVKWEALKGF